MSENMKVHIISDSTCDLSKDLIERFGVRILPLHVHLGDEEYLDGVNITQGEIFEWSDRNRTTPKTSAPALSDAMAIFEESLKEGGEIITFSISDQMSTTGNVMRLAAENLGMEDKIHVVDSANLSTGIGLLVLEAARMAQEGAASADILARIAELKGKVRASFVVDTLTYLYRGGRCSGVAAFAGSTLHLHPLISVENGKMAPGKKYRGRMDKVIMSYVKEMEPALRSAMPERVFITHAACSGEIIESVRAYLEGLNIFQEICVTDAGCVISSHCGPGTLGVLFIEK